MVALLTADPIYTFPERLAPETVPLARRSRPRHLTAVPAPHELSPGTDAGSSPDVDVSHRHIAVADAVAIAAVVVVGLLLLVSFRSVQGGPAATSWSQLNTPAAAVGPAVQGEIVVSVAPGDTLWAIAGALAPDADRREVVQRLAERNGGSTIWAGQELIVPVSVANL